MDEALKKMCGLRYIHLYSHPRKYFGANPIGFCGQRLPAADLSDTTSLCARLRLGRQRMSLY
jgi:hypothetical protein